MEYRTLGATGVQVSAQCLGAMMFGAMGNTDHDDCIRIIHRALDAGINFIDTADVYSAGESEKIVGAALADRRDDVVLATKFFGVMGEDPNRRGGSRRWIMTEVENSLRRLGTDYIDLYQIHRYPDGTALDETISALTDLQRAGKIRYFGHSAFPADRIVEGQWIAEDRSLGRFRCEQCSYSLFSRRVEYNVLPTCARYGLGVITYSPLAGGWLSGRYRSAEDFGEDSRIVRLAKRWGGFDPEEELNQRRLRLSGAIQAVADDAGLPMAHLAVAFTQEHPAVTSTIVGPRTMDQLEDLLAAAEVRLETDVLDALDEIAPPGTNVAPRDPSSEPAGMSATARRRIQGT
ncbi:MAG: aldo/keto reductase [Acidimicrobiales bacterium]|nr:aldo/keto reductase [Acidimicrobiales bacterium]